MALFPTENVKIAGIHFNSSCLRFALTQRQDDVLRYIQGESHVRFKKKTSSALAATLRFLHQEGQLHAENTPHSAPFSIPFEQLYRIPDTLLRKHFGIRSLSPLSLRPPPRGQFSVLLSSRGDDPLSENFDVRAEVRLDGRVISKSLMHGPLISTGKETFTLMPHAAWKCLERLSNAESEQNETILAKNYHKMAIAQDFARYDYIRPDAFIATNLIACPKSISLTLDRDKHEFICRIHPEGVPREAFEEAFERHGADIPAAYSIQTDNDERVTRVYFDSVSRSQLQQVARKRRIKGEEVRSLLEDPAKFLGLPEQSSFWNLEELSSRVAGWGVFVADDAFVSETPESARDKVFLAFASKTPLETESLDLSAVPLSSAGFSESQLTEMLVALDAAITEQTPYVDLPHAQVTVTEDRYTTFRKRIREALDKLQEQEEGVEAESNKIHLISKSNTHAVLHANENKVQATRADQLFHPINLPYAMRSTLPGNRPIVAHPHQQQGISWLLGLYDRSKSGDVGCLLADDMGLGKTFQIITFLASIAETESPGPSLVVCPTTLRQNWVREIALFIEESAGWDVQVLAAGVSSPPRLSDRTIVITNYEQIYNRHSDFFLKTAWKCVFMDEAQKFKNPGSRLHNYLRALKAPFKVAMTGTPVENRLQDLWAIFDVVHPGLLGHREGFVESFEAPLKDLAPGSPERLALRRQLEELLGAHFLRRIKSQIPSAKLPAITHHEPTFCPMTNCQVRLYTQVVKSALNRTMPFIAAMQGLLVISSHPAAYDESLVEQDSDEYIALSTKLKRCLEMLHTIKQRQEKVIIFEKYLTIQQILIVAIETELGVNPLRINGEVAPEVRQGLIADWEKKPGFQVLVMSPRTGGAGLTIVAANHVIHFTREYNPAVEMQATDRVYRIGQMKDVEVHYPVSVPTMDTIDESIELHLDRIQRYKRHIADDFTFPIGTSDASSHVDQAKTSNSRHTKLSDLFSTLRPERQPDQTLQARFYEALETRYGEDIQWQRIDLADIEPRATLLLNKHTGEGKLFYLKFENDAVDEVPQLLTNGLDDLKRSQPDLRAVIEKTIVIDDSIKPLRLFEKARTLGIELMQISRV